MQATALCRTAEPENRCEGTFVLTQTGSQRKQRRRKSVRRKYVRRIAVLVALTIGIVIYGYVRDGNFHEVVDDQVYRSARPSPGQARRWIQQHDLRTILVLRERTTTGAAEVREVAAEHDVDVVYLPLSAYAHIDSPSLVRLIELLEESPKPLLLHCRAGFDRSGVASALAAWYVGGQSYAEAKWQSIPLPGKWLLDPKRTHIHDVFAEYEAWCDREGRDPDDREQFRKWAAEVYQRDADADTSGGLPGNAKEL